MPTAMEAAPSAPAALPATADTATDYSYFDNDIDDGDGDGNIN